MLHSASVCVNRREVLYKANCSILSHYRLQFAVDKTYSYFLPLPRRNKKSKMPVKIGYWSLRGVSLNRFYLHSFAFKVSLIYL